MEYPIAFIICTEPAIEKQSILLARSIRRWAGKLADTPIFSYGPRGRGIAESTRAEFTRLGVQHSDEVLNREFPDYKFANKILACAHAEQTVAAEYLAYFDSDVVIFNEPAALRFDRGGCAAARPVDLHQGNSAVRNLSGNDQDSLYWRRLYQVCRTPLQPETFITTAITNQTVLAYFNGGLLVTRPETALFARWVDNFRGIMADGIMPTQPYFIEQSSFAATVCAHRLPWHILPDSYNVPFIYQRQLPPERRLQSLDHAVSIHYHRAFTNWRRFLGGMDWLEQSGARFEWLVQNLSALGFWQPTGQPRAEPTSVIQQSFALAVQHHQAGRLKEAEPLYWRILDQQPNHAGAWHHLGVIAFGVGRHVIAADMFRQAIAITPNWPEAHGNLAGVLQAQGNMDEAIAAYRQALALQPNFPEAYYNLGLAWQAKGQIDHAIAAWRQAVALKPDFPEARRDLDAALKTASQLA